MNSRARAIIVIAVAVLVPFLALRHRWAEIRAFAHQLEANLSLGSDDANQRKPVSSGRLANGHTGGGVAPVESIDPKKVIADALTASANPAEAGRKLLTAIPSLPEKEKVDAVRHLTNLVADDDYLPVEQMLANPETSVEIQNLLLADVLNRRNSVKLPALLEIARTPDNAKSAEAREMLRPFLMQDYSDDWNKNEAKVNQWLREHPDS